MSDETPNIPAEMALEPLTDSAPPAVVPDAAFAVSGLDIVLDVPVELAVEIGRTSMTIRETLDLGPGSIVVLERMTGEPVDLLVNGRRIARGEVVAIDEQFGLRITTVVPTDKRLDAAA
ncbi:MAG: flagellar motor switch protein FliN [Gaiellales bacterium]